MDRLKLFETEETIWDIKATYYASLEDGCVILSKSTELSDEIKECERDKVVSDLKNDIFNQLERYFEDWQLYCDLPIFTKGWYLTESDFNLIISNIRSKYNSIKQEAEKTRTPFIDYLESVGLRPRPSGSNKFSWMADCPFSKGKHWIMVSTKDNGYGCGWCKKKGDQNDIESFLNRMIYKLSELKGECPSNLKWVKGFIENETYSGYRFKYYGDKLSPKFEFVDEWIDFVDDIDEYFAFEKDRVPLFVCDEYLLPGILFEKGKRIKSPIIAVLFKALMGSKIKGLGFYSIDISKKNQYAFMKKSPLYFFEN